MRWSSARGPLQAAWMSLRRLGWDMASAVALVSDQGHTIILTGTCPAEMAIREPGIARWQARRVRAKLGFDEVD